MLSARTPALKDDFKISLQLENPLQKETLSEILGELLTNLRNELNNGKITLETEIVEEKEDTQNNKLYTMEDKFNYLAQKNKTLQKLKKDFDLDFDY
jgi:DNA polymerase-3 subunit gamma/tau